MNDFDQEQLNLSSPTDRYSVAPGGRLEIPLLLTNLGSMPDQVRISIEGIPLVWVSVEQPVLLLQPGEERRIILTVQPPAPPNAHAGRYNLRLRVASTIDPERSAQTPVTLTVAGFEVKGRVGVLLDGLQYKVIPGEQLAVPVVLINQGLGADTFQLAVEGLPMDWITIPVPAVRLEPGESKEAILIVQPFRQPETRPGRHPFRLLVTSQEAPDQGASIDCILTVAAFIEFNSALEAAQPDQNLPNRVVIQNFSNIPAAFQVTFDNLEDALTFEPEQPQPINIPSGETAKLDYAARPTRRLWVGGEKVFPYAVKVQSSDQQTQTLKSTWNANGLVPVWAAVAGVGALLLLCLCLIGALLIPRAFQGQPSTETPLFTSTPTIILPTATTSQIDQSVQLVERRWYLTSFNDTRSVPGAQESFILFNPDSTLIGFTGCKDLRGNFQTNFNQISISNVSLGSGACPDASLQGQEDALVAILRSARSYFVADTALQIAGDAGFLNYSLTPVNRPEEIVPPQAAISAVPQAEAGQVVVFDGSSSTGQVPLVSWKWEFGDGVTASGVVVQHTYRDPGAFTVRLTVTDQRNQTGTITQQIHILAAPTATARPTDTPLPPTVPPPTDLPEPPTATSEPPTQEPVPEQEPPQANLASPTSGYVGEPVAFDASGSREGSSPIVSYTWSFGNGDGLPASPSPSATTTYNRTGDFEVTVVVYDANGLSSYATSRISINARLETSVWSLLTINGQPLIPGTAITAQFLNGELTGFAGCNTYDGRYTTSDNGDGTISVTVEQVRTGRRSCPSDIMTQENNFVSALQQATLAAIQENRITLSYPGGTLDFYLIYRP